MTKAETKKLKVALRTGGAQAANYANKHHSLRHELQQRILDGMISYLNSRKAIEFEAEEIGGDLVVTGTIKVDHDMLTDELIIFLN